MKKQVLIGVMGATQPLAGSGERSITGLKDSDYRTACEMASSGKFTGSRIRER